MAMAHDEEHEQKCSNSSGGGLIGRSSKKLKPKKIPQRGLGVAQLEKIRLEEQQRRDNNNNTNSNSNNNNSNSVVLSLPNPMVSSMNSLACLQMPQSQSILLPNISRPIFSSSSSLPTPQSSKVDHHLHSKPLMISDHTQWPRFWNGEYNLEGEQRRLDQHGFSFRPNVNSPVESHNSVLPLPRSQQYQQPVSSSMVNILSGISSSSPSVQNFQIEPPSNQSYLGNSYKPLWPEEIKTIGVKRPYPFSPEYPPVPSFNCKFSPGYVSSTSRAHEPTSCSNSSSIVNLESRNLPMREDNSNSDALFDTSRGLSGDFLTLAPPAASRNLIPLNKEASSSQGGNEEMNKRSGQPQIFSFFPVAKEQTEQEKSPNRSCKSDSNVAVDLNLKL